MSKVRPKMKRRPTNSEMDKAFEKYNQEWFNAHNGVIYGGVETRPTREAFEKSFKLKY